MTQEVTQTKTQHNTARRSLAALDVHRDSSAVVQPSTWPPRTPSLPLLCWDSRTAELSKSSLLSSVLRIVLDKFNFYATQEWASQSRRSMNFWLPLGNPVSSFTFVTNFLNKIKRKSFLAHLSCYVACCDEQRLLQKTVDLLCSTSL